jgi:multidrug efflux pump subunit AcrA (membrane-fusion protein)
MSSSEIHPSNINAAAARIAVLAQQGGAADDFYQRFLRELPLPSGTIGTIAWLCEPEAFHKLAAVAANPDQGIQLPYTNDEHTAMLLHARDTAVPQLFDPPAQSDYQVFVENVLPQTAIIPVVAEATTRALIEVFLPPSMANSEYAEFQRDASILCEIASNYHLGNMAQTGSRAGLPSNVFSSLNVTDTCYALANESRQTLGCDRASILLAKGDRFVMKSVSGQEAVNRRANVVRFLERLTARVLKTGQPFWYPADFDQLAPEIEFELEQYIEASMARRLAILPLFVIEQEHDQKADELPAKQGRNYGALVAEDFTDAVNRGEEFKAEAVRVAEEAAISLRNSVAHEEIFLLPVWRFIGEQRRWFQGSKRRITYSVLAALGLLALVLTFVQIPFRVSSVGRLQPTIRRNVFATIDGTVKTLHVDHGSQVKQGDVLAELRNTEVDLAMEQLRSEIRRSQARMAALKTEQRLRTREKTANSGRSASAEAAELQKLIESLEQQVEIQAQRKNELSIPSPIGGEVITWNLEDRLQDRPVMAGQSLMRIAKLDGPWRLELNLPDRSISHLLRAREKSEEPLKVSFILASDPGTRYEGRVVEAANATQVDPTEGQHLLVFAEIDNEEIQWGRAGTEVQAKVDCGKRSVGYVWLHGVIEFIQSRILFRFT